MSISGLAMCGVDVFRIKMVFKWHEQLDSDQQQGAFYGIEIQLFMASDDHLISFRVLLLGVVDR